MQEYQENYNNSEVSLPEGFVGMGNNTKGRNYSPAWGGQFQMGGNIYPVNYVPEAQMGASIPGAVGFSYARVGAPSKGPRRNQTDVTDASAQNGQEMKYYQDGLDFKPKSISQNGGWLNKYDVAQNGEQVEYGTPEYEEAYNRGEVVTDEGGRSPIELEEVVVKGKPLTEFGKTRKEIAEKNKWEQFAQRFLGNFEKNMGQTLENLPESRKQEYEDYINKLAFDEYIKTHPQAKGEKRGAYIDRMQAENVNSSNFERAYEANAPYNDATDVNKWRKGLIGLGSLVMGPGAINDLKQTSGYFSTKEKQDLIENPILSNIDTTLGTLEPITIPVEAMYGNKSIGDIASGQSADIPMSARLLGDPMMLAFEAAPLVGKGFGYVGNKLDEAKNIISANLADETTRFKEVAKDVSEGVKEFGKNVKGIYSGERRANSDEIAKLYDDERELLRSDEYLKWSEDEFKLNKKEGDLKWKIDHHKSPSITAKRNELNDKIRFKQARVDTSNTLTLNNEGLVQSGKDTSLGLRTGSTDIIDLQTGTSTPISTSVPREEIRFDLKGDEVIKTVSTKTKPEVTPEYISTVKKNIDFIETQIPGSKVFGSAKNVAETEVPHIIGDYDVLMSQTEYEKFAKNNPAIGTNGFAKVHDIPGAAKGIDPIDVNIIEETAGKATGTRAEELFRQVAPDEFYESAKQAIKNKSEIKIPYSSQELVDMTNPTTKSVVDAYESTKSKHLNKIDALINYGKPDVVAQGQQQYVKSLVGSRGTIGPQFPVEQLSDVATNETILDKIDFIGNKNLVASDPQRMQLALNDYYINNSVLVRQVEKGPIDKIEAAITQYNPEAGGGALNGIGQNHVTLGFPHHGVNNITAIKQIGMNLDTSSPLAYLDDFEHQTSGSKIFSEEERNILSEIVDGMTDESFKRTGIDLRKHIGQDKDAIKGSKNSTELIDRLPYSKEGKQALYDFARKTNRQMVKKDYNYGTSNFTTTLRDFDEGLDAMKFTAIDQVEMSKVLKSYSDRAQAAESYSPKKIDELLPKQFKGLKGYLEGGIERAEQRIAALKAEKDEINSYRDVASKLFNKKYKEQIERSKQYRDQIEKQLQDMQQMRRDLVTRQMDLQEFEKKFKVYLASTLGVTAMGLLFILDESRRDRRDEGNGSGRMGKKDSEKPQPKPQQQQQYEQPIYGIPRKNGGIVDSDRGQWDYPGEITRIKGGNITMKKDPRTGKALTEPILGIANTGERKMMYPGQDYNFYDADYVTEIPKSKLAKNGLRQEQKGLVNLDQLTNFTNYNKPQPGGWLNKYN
jgi:hypothetical protein